MEFSRIRTALKFGVATTVFVGGVFTAGMAALTAAALLSKAASGMPVSMEDITGGNLLQSWGVLMGIATFAGTVVGGLHYAAKDNVEPSVGEMFDEFLPEITHTGRALKNHVKRLFGRGDETPRR